MSIASLGGVGAEAAAAGTTPPVNSLGQEEFLKILLTQLNYQDPLKPLDNQQFIAQLAQFSSLEQSNQLNSKVDNLLSIQSINQSVSLLNKTVEVSTVSGSVVGTVSTLLFRDGQPVFTVKKADNSILTDITPSQISVIR